MNLVVMIIWFLPAITQSIMSQGWAKKKIWKWLICMPNADDFCLVALRVSRTEACAVRKCHFIIGSEELIHAAYCRA